MQHFELKKKKKKREREKKVHCQCLEKFMRGSYSPSLPFDNHGYCIPLSRNNSEHTVFPLRIFLSLVFGLCLPRSLAKKTIFFYCLPSILETNSHSCSSPAFIHVRPLYRRSAASNSCLASPCIAAAILIWPEPQSKNKNG